MNIEVDTVKGFQDYLPPESLKRSVVKAIIEKKFKLYGFIPIETPTIEFDELMRSDTLGEEDEAISDRFRLKDRAGRDLGLRYEFTFQLARIFKLNPNIKLPLRRYQIGSTFRDEPIGKGRFREFSQCDADIIGDSSLNADAECIALFCDILKELKVDYEIEINNRKLLNAIIESVQIESKKQVMKELDKLGKVGEDEVKIKLRKYADTNQIITLFKLMEKNLDFFIKNAFDGAKELEELQEICDDYGIKLKFNPFMIRGFGYYNGNIFEIKAAGEKNTIAAGGRYDKVVGKYIAREIPAVGISIGLERATELAKVEIERPKTIIISLNRDIETIKLSKKLRKSNISCIPFFDRAGKSLEFANSESIPYAIFIGDEEIEKKKFKLKKMSSGEEKLLTEKQLIKALK